MSLKYEPASEPLHNLCEVVDLTLRTVPQVLPALDAHQPEGFMVQSLGFQVWGLGK